MAAPKAEHFCVGIAAAHIGYRGLTA